MSDKGLAQMTVVALIVFALLVLLMLGEDGYTPPGEDY